jgi:hypothetical protein
MEKEYGVFFAVLPAQPTVPPSLLKGECEKIANDVEFPITWTHDRVAALIHPQLKDPLPFLEISGKLSITADDAVSPEAMCSKIVDELNSRHSVVGNAELLLILKDTPIPVLDTELPKDGSVETFHKYGLVAMENALALDDIEQLQELAIKTFECLHAEMATRSGGGKHLYKEIMQRDENRFDFRLDLGVANSVGSSTWKDIEAKGKWLPLVQKILGTGYSLIKCACVLSLPGTGVQYWHSDGVHNGASANFGSDQAAPTHALCVFVPLIDLDIFTGFTEFWAGSHKYSKLLAKKGEQALPGGTNGLLKKGECLLYDYRTIHRGMPNTSKGNRPVCYFLYTKPGQESVENQNFVTNSVFD